MSNLDDPRVLLAAERTVLAWARTAAGFMALGFLIDRSALVLAPQGTRVDLAFWIGLGFVLLGIASSALAAAQYRRSVGALRSAEIPPGYWVNLSAYVTGAVGLLGIALASYIVIT